MWKITACLYAWIIAVSFVQPVAASEVVSFASRTATVDDAIFKASLRYGVSYDLMQAIATVESGKNPNALGAIDDTGLFQLRKRFFGDGASLDPYINANTAAQYLIHVEKKCRPKYGRAWLICFNTGPYRKQRIKDPIRFVYYQKVMAAMPQITATRTLADNH